MRTNKTVLVIKHLINKTGRTQFSLREIFNAQMETLWENEALRAKYLIDNPPFLLDEHGEYVKNPNKKTFTQALYKYPEPTWSIEIFSGNLYQQVNKRKNPLIQRVLLTVPNKTDAKFNAKAPKQNKLWYYSLTKYGEKRK